MDCAKGINFLLSNGGRMQDYWGIGKATRPMLPMIAVPTTAGTGSETQSFALISDAETHVKMACGDKKASFRVALLDPALTVTQPPRVTALTGIDAWPTPWKPMSPGPQRRCRWRSAAKRGCCWPRTLPACSTIRPTWKPAPACNWGLALPGLAIENSMLGATHALANPLTARIIGIVHGQAIGLMLPHVIRFNGVEVGAWYHDLLEVHRRGQRVSAARGGRRGLGRFRGRPGSQGRPAVTLVGVRRRARAAARIGGRRGQAMDRQLQSAYGRRGRTVATCTRRRIECELSVVSCQLSAVSYETLL